MSPEQAVEAVLRHKFAFLQGKIRIARPRRVFVEAPSDRVREVFDYLVHDAGFPILCTATGLDLGSTLGVLYHLAQEDGMVLTLSTAVPKEAPVLRTVTDRFPAADAYEREMVDLLGMRFEGLAPGSRYPLPDDWPAGQYPLRKDWKQEAETGAAPEESSHA